MGPCKRKQKQPPTDNKGELAGKNPTSVALHLEEFSGACLTLTPVPLVGLSFNGTRWELAGNSAFVGILSIPNFIPLLSFLVSTGTISLRLVSGTVHCLNRLILYLKYRHPTQMQVQVPVAPLPIQPIKNVLLGKLSQQATQLENHW